jgi:hypothetical protein
VLEESLHILKAYDKDVSNGIKVSYFGKEHIDAETFMNQSLEKESLHVAIAKEKLRIRNIIKNQTILNTYTDIL